MAICINDIQIKNFRCFKNESLKFKVPDGNIGSGLNIIVGENGNGKTTILEAINYLTLNRFSSENKLNISDFNNIKEEIEIIGSTSEFHVDMGGIPYKNHFFKVNGIEFRANSRTRKEANKLLSKPFQINNLFKTVDANYKKPDGTDSEKPIPPLLKSFDSSRIIGDGVNVFYFDKNRTRQISSGNYKTTFERICDDFNWKFVKDLTPENISRITHNITGEYFTNVSEIAQKGAGERIANDVAEFFKNDDYKNIGIDLIDLLHPYKNAFFALRKDDNLQQIAIKDLGSGIEIILTLLLLKNIAGESKGSIIYLIDEPELHLHPKAQEKLVTLLLEESKDKQIILSTHSPYLLKNALINDIGIIIPKRNEDGEIKLSDASTKDWGIFPWSPTWGEINYNAYDMPTIDFHNELYGYLQESSGNYNISTFDDYLNSKGVEKNKEWIKVSNGIPQSPISITLISYIRNSIHHPENTNNSPFSQEELVESIVTLMTFIEENIQ